MVRRTAQWHRQRTGAGKHGSGRRCYKGHAGAARREADYITKKIRASPPSMAAASAARRVGIFIKGSNWQVMPGRCLIGAEIPVGAKYLWSGRTRWVPGTLFIYLR